MTIRTIKGRIVLAIVLVGCIPLLIGLILAYMSGMRSLRDVIGGNFQAIAEQAADRLTMLVQSEVQGYGCLHPRRYGFVSRSKPPICLTPASGPTRSG